MFKMNPRVQGTSEEVIALYRQVMPSTIGHMTDFGFLKGLRPLFPGSRLVGNAVTVRIPHMDSSAVHQALTIAEAGDVIVVDMSGDTERSCWGGVLSYIARQKGLAGVVVAGCVNDVAEIIDLKFPVFSLGVSPLTTRIVGIEGEINTVISVCGTSIRPGDLIVADDDGAFAVHPAEAESFGRRAVDIQNAEVELKRKLQAGATIASISGAEAFFTRIEETGER
ncbi:RraA family protein [Cohnella algarum]|uniref:RraA family protein n=1 Tax=Cohnella algarum TaxID=2044859 RepID=UPI001966D288|nr:RraA family protein [Cohnella algarum]MBN2984416.1 RraA family protein [Cohnella algarum]